MWLQVQGYSGNSYKGFQTREEAAAWIRPGLTLSALSGNKQDISFPSSHTSIEVEKAPIVADVQEDGRAANVISASATARGGINLNEARPTSPVVPVEEPRPILSAEQQRVVDLALDGRSIFFTGSAGLLYPFSCVFFLTHNCQELANL